jgi:hypothetical protein
MENWAEKISNDLTWCTGKGDWEIYKDGEGEKELYYKGDFVDALPSAYFELSVFEKGVLVSAKEGVNGNKISHFLLFTAKTKENIARIEGKNITVEITENSFITFSEVLDNGEIESTTYDLNSFTKTTVCKDGQIGLEF